MCTNKENTYLKHFVLSKIYSTLVNRLKLKTSIQIEIKLNIHTTNWIDKTMILLKNIWLICAL